MNDRHSNRERVERGKRMRREYENSNPFPFSFSRQHGRIQVQKGSKETKEPKDLTKQVKTRNSHWKRQQRTVFENQELSRSKIHKTHRILHQRKRDSFPGSRGTNRSSFPNWSSCEKSMSWRKFLAPESVHPHKSCEAHENASQWYGNYCCSLPFLTILSLPWHVELNPDSLMPWCHKQTISEWIHPVKKDPGIIQAREERRGKKHNNYSKKRRPRRIQWKMACPGQEEKEKTECFSTNSLCPFVLFRPEKKRFENEKCCQGELWRVMMNGRTRS